MSAAERAFRAPEGDAEEGTFSLPPLPWAADALEPVISKGAVELHHQKHHRGYVKKLNKLVEGSPLAELSLEELIRKTAADPDKREIFNNAAQVWNHTFFFHNLKSPGPRKIPGALQDLIAAEFGSMDKMCDEIVKFALERFGSGWAWLSLRGRHLEITSTPNAGTPLTTDVTPLMALDVWEHAYYLDYHERREAYARAVLTMVTDWDVVAKRGGL
ncbi:superoxide dismutase [Usitatibacter palustris]|uniref:Superoxide dismutase n=1 Tax=Usitatibacter palustris TaxID=2732487 RepID=A0A6M4H1T4_9PROT|nr:superoxide dismutase [Usitatibacter palustris]QJR13471.1 Superoxide dismutase [Fe] [Usitatibacter palustris]